MKIRIADRILVALAGLLLILLAVCLLDQTLLPMGVTAWLQQLMTPASVQLSHALYITAVIACVAVLALLGAILGPLARTLAVVFVMKLSAALLEPVADGEIVRAIGDFSRTIVLILITMLCVGTMYFLLIVQLLLVGNLTVMLR